MRNPHIATVTSEVFAPDIISDVADEARLLWDTDWPEGIHEPDLLGKKSDWHPVLTVDFGSEEVIEFLSETAPTLVGVVVDVMAKPTNIRDATVIPANVGRISINYGWPGFRSGKHIDFEPIDTRASQDRVSRLLYVSGSGTLELYTEQEKVSLPASAGDFIEFYNKADAPLPHQGFTAGAEERIVVGFQQYAYRNES